MNTSSTVITGLQFPAPAPAADWSRKTAGDGGDAAPRFELPVDKSAEASTLASKRTESSDARAIESKVDDKRARDAERSSIRDSKAVATSRAARTQRAERQKSAKSETDQGNTAVNPWLQGQTAAGAEPADGAGGDGTSPASAEFIQSAIDAQATEAAHASAADAAVDAATVQVQKPAADSGQADSPSPLTDILKLWSQLRPAQQQTATAGQSATPVQAASAQVSQDPALLPAGLLQQTASAQAPTPGSTAPAAGAVPGQMAPAVNVAVADGATLPAARNTASSVAALLQMIGSGANDAASAAAARASGSAPAASDSGDAQTVALTAAPIDVRSLSTFLLSTMSGDGKGGKGQGDDSSLKNFLAMMQSSAAPTGTASDANLNAVVAGIQGLAAAMPVHTDGNMAAGTGAGVPNQLSLALHSAGWETALSDRVHLLLHATADGDVNEARIQLHPREMGSIQIHVRMGSEGADIRFAATHPDVRQALETSLPRLRELLASGGLSLGQAQVGSQLSQGFQQSRAQPSQSTASVAPAMAGTSEDEGTETRRVRIASVSLVDDYA